MPNLAQPKTKTWPAQASADCRGAKKLRNNILPRGAMIVVYTILVSPPCTQHALGNPSMRVRGSPSGHASSCHPAAAPNRPGSDAAAAADCQARRRRTGCHPVSGPSHGFDGVESRRASPRRPRPQWSAHDSDDSEHTCYTTHYHVQPWAGSMGRAQPTWQGCKIRVPACSARLRNRGIPNICVRLAPGGDHSRPRD